MQMIDVNYNDGKWHGWNGGECPVHPKSLVKFATTAGHDAGEAREFVWNGPDHLGNPIIAFCVIEEYVEPRDYYFSASCPMVFDSREKAEAYATASGNRSPLIHARQVKKENQ